MKLLLERWKKFINEETRDTYGSEVVDRNKATFKKALTEDDDEVEKAIGDELDAEGGAAGLDPLVKAAKEVDPDITEEEVKEMLDGMKGVKQHEEGDYIDVAELKEAASIFLEMKEELLDEKKKKKQQKGKKRAAKSAKRKKKKAAKRDACYHKVKSRYSVWPSAYASGALVKCRKVGAANWGKSKKK